MKAAEGEDLLTAGAIAKAIGAPDAKVKKAIKDLAIKPKAKKGVCSYYGPDALAKVRKAVAK
jgi:aspartate/methionine/tyrosine aminotransferase